MHKLSYLREDQWLEHSYAPVFAESSMGSEGKRIVAGVPDGDVRPYERLVLTMEAPYVLLYILHTPRGEGEGGRYESPELTVAQLRSFVARFGAYLSSDSRFDIWAYSPSEQATVVWDRHNQLFAYGHIEKFVYQLQALGFHTGQAEVPVPHQHHFRREFDAHASELLAAFEWAQSPLRPEDEQ
jgi:hypothetical protein